MKQKSIMKIGFRFNDVYSRDNLPKTIKNGAHVINLDEYADVGTHWIALKIFTLMVLVLTCS